MEKPTCETCAYWDLVGGPDGRCCRKCPTNLDFEENGIFPMVSQYDTCGDHPDFEQWEGQRSPRSSASKVSRELRDERLAKELPHKVIEGFRSLGYVLEYAEEIALRENFERLIKEHIKEDF